MKIFRISILALLISPLISLGATPDSAPPVEMLPHTFAVSSHLGDANFEWQEEALQSDGSVITLNRSRKNHWVDGSSDALVMIETINLRVSIDSSLIKWQQKWTYDYPNLLVLSVNVISGIPYIVTQPLDDKSYFQRGCPNPPYVIFKYINDEWVQIPMSELPAEITEANVVVLASDQVVFTLVNHDEVIPVAKVQSLNDQIFALTTGYATRIYERKNLEADDSIICGLNLLYHGKLFSSTEDLIKLKY
ncbi:hypothetical protein [Methyloradius palustris]|uniref:Uncharacterized protein n=1 Tax=Methyloradius palustris TaxID=2778876 RepID=A0A8D5G7B8_9PROT|nr:hypothetical protein [Methyloradius palustris]BCM24487.1 hypothetical protein ZMTM_07460 [Methyloradius palustris]